MDIETSARSDTGLRRDHNEDDFAIANGQDTVQFGTLLVVCDGMGGHAAGEVASELAVNTIMDTYYRTVDGARDDALCRAFEEANRRVFTEGRGVMGTTGVAALLYQARLYVANVGDSRAYHIRGSQITQITRDHSLVADQIAAGLITAEQARTLTYRNVITRAIGHQGDIQVDVFSIPLQDGDIILLASDGLTGMVRDDEIRQLIGPGPLDDASDALVNRANECGGTDNITVALARVSGIPASDGAAAPLPAPPLPVPPVTRRVTPLGTPVVARTAGSRRTAMALAAAFIIGLILFGALMWWQPATLPPLAPQTPTPGVIGD
ncbi:MAG: Stp1/IreP family PP2C-type Ser/Thr phosphatase [Chloroflexi bacterium]|nr:Stp1/IreP family PP2C-type Ser/Thr phosphatase [Chloroflexota bacterium]